MRWSERPYHSQPALSPTLSEKSFDGSHPAKYGRQSAATRAASGQGCHRIRRIVPALSTYQATQTAGKGAFSHTIVTRDGPAPLGRAGGESVLKYRRPCSYRQHRPSTDSPSRPRSTGGRQSHLVGVGGVCEGPEDPVPGLSQPAGILLRSRSCSTTPSRRYRRPDP